MAGPLITVWSPKGGVGTTLIAAGLAMQLVRRLPGETVLIDLDPRKADLAPLLQSPSRPSVLDYPGDGRTVPHPSGLQILPGPARLVDEGLVTGPMAAAVLKQAVASAGLVVADVGADLRDSSMIALEQADAVLLITTPDLLSLYQVRRFTREAELVGLDLGKFRLVINRTTARQEIPNQEVRELVGLPVAGLVPSLQGLAAAVNRGMMSATMRSYTDFAEAMNRIADQLSFAGVPTGRRQPAPDDRPAGLITAIRRWWRKG